MKAAVSAGAIEALRLQLPELEPGQSPLLAEHPRGAGRGCGRSAAAGSSAALQLLGPRGSCPDLGWGGWRQEFMHKGKIQLH